eukprot:1762999-Amphidinium_carterae.1
MSEASPTAVAEILLTMPEVCNGFSLSVLGFQSDDLMNSSYSFDPKIRGCKRDPQFHAHTHSKTRITRLLGVSMRMVWDDHKAHDSSNGACHRETWWYENYAQRKPGAAEFHSRLAPPIAADIQSSKF